MNISNVIIGKGREEEKKLSLNVLKLLLYKIILSTGFQVVSMATDPANVTSTAVRAMTSILGRLSVVIHVNQKQNRILSPQQRLNQ